MYIHVHNVHMYINVNYCLWNIRCIKTFYERLFEKRDEVLELSEALILALDAKGAVPWICLLFHPKKGLNYSYTFSSVKYKGFFFFSSLNFNVSFFFLTISRFLGDGWKILSIHRLSEKDFYILLSHFNNLALND